MLAVILASTLIFVITYWLGAPNNQSSSATVKQVQQGPNLEAGHLSPLMETNNQAWLNDRFWSNYIVAGRPQLKYKVINLRVLGFPEHCINGLIKAEIDARYGGVVAELKQKARLSRMTGSTVSLRSEIESLVRKKNTDYEAATGASLNQAVEIAALEAEINSLFTDIDPERSRQIGDVLGKYNSQLGPGNHLDPLQFKRLVAERDLELSKILTPEEKRQFDVAYSAAGAELRLWTKYMNLSEHQFDAAFDIQKTFDDGISSWQLSVGKTNDRLPDDLSDRLKLRDEQLKSVLGEGGYSQYKMVSDPYFQNLDRWAAGRQLPSDVVDAAYRLRQEVGSAYVQYLTDGQLDGAARFDYQNRLIEYSRDALQRIMGDGSTDYDIGSPPLQLDCQHDQQHDPVDPGALIFGRREKAVENRL